MRPLLHPRLVNIPCGAPGLPGDALHARRALLVDLGALEALAPRALQGPSHGIVSHARMDRAAATRHHLTARQAGRPAPLAGGGPLVSFDVSLRYAGREARLVEEAFCVFADTARTIPRARRTAVEFFTVGNESNHHAHDRACPACWEGYPEPCRCGGLMHAAGGEEEDPDGNALLVTRCDQCGRSEDQLDEV